MSSALRAATTAAANAAGLINNNSSSNGAAAAPSRPAVSRTVSRLDVPSQPATAPPLGKEDSEEMVLELADGSSHKGISFGARGKSISGECVFQTGEYHKEKKVGQWEDQTERAGKELRRVREYLNWARFESLKVKLHAKEDIARKRFSAWKMDKSKEIFSLADPLLVPFRLSLPLQVWLDTSNLSPIHPTKVKF